MPKIPKTNQDSNPPSVPLPAGSAGSAPEETGKPGAWGPKSTLGPYRTQLDQLKERLEDERTLAQEREELVTNQQDFARQRQELLATIVRKEGVRTESEDLLQKLNVKGEINAAELDYTQEQLERQQAELQGLLMHVQAELHKLWRAWLEFAQHSEYQALEAQVHPEFRARQRSMIEQLAMISVGVIECRKLEPTLHSLATTYLYDTPAHKFSEQRPQTVRMVEAETERICAQSEALFSALEELAPLGLAIPAPTATTRHSRAHALRSATQPGNYNRSRPNGGCHLNEPKTTT